MQLLQTASQVRFRVTILSYSSNMAVNDQLFDGDEEDDPFQALERDDDPIVWETTRSLRREQTRIFLEKQDQIHADRLAEIADADAALLELLQQHRYNDEGFLEKLDPELYGTLDEGEEDDEIDLGLMEDVEDVLDDESPEDLEDDDAASLDEDDVETGNKVEEAIAEVSEPVTKLSSVEFKVDVLERLAALRRSGDLTENEFESMKAELLR